MSFAHPLVRERFLGIVDELVAYGPEGLNLMMIRGLPAGDVYEPVMVEGFMAKHGVDPRSLAETDERWLDYQAGVITELMRAVKGRMKGGCGCRRSCRGGRRISGGWGWLGKRGWR